MPRNAKKSPQPPQDRSPDAPPADPSATSSGSEYAADRSPSDLQAELEGLAFTAGAPGPSSPPAGDSPEDLRRKVRGAWMGAGAMLEVMFGPELHHDERDLDTLTAATVPMAELFGLEWLGNWVHVIGFAGAVASVELPKMRALRTRALLTTGEPPAPAGTVRRPRYRDVSDEAAPPPPDPVPAPSGARPPRGPAPTEGQ